ncbi:MAG: ABC transporter substrate-binding protein [bacterium]|nr:ABC transporter substrate-binding protein [bacterium]
MHKALLAFLISGFLGGLAFQAKAEKLHALSVRGAPKYDAGFSNFGYVNPDAPQGGRIIIGAIGVFDTLNPYCVKGVPAAGVGVFGMGLVFESLMKRASDEPFTVYTYLAESVEAAPDSSWVIFHINPKAKWADGKPLTAEDVKFTHEILKEKGRPHLRLSRRNVESCEVLNPLTIKFTFKPQGEENGQKFYNPELPLIIGVGSVLPKHALEGRDFDHLTQEILPGSGPYRISKFDMGRSITFEQRPDYWGNDLPVMKGIYNFKEIRFDYYRNTQVALEAFKAGAYDFQIVTDPNRWQADYHFAAVQEGQVKKLEFVHERPVGMRGFVMNTRKEKFADPRVRRALLYAFSNFEDMNKRLYGGSLNRTHSYFENTELRAPQKISAAEKTLTEKLSIDVSSQLPALPEASNSKEFRTHLLEARNLLKAAGWEIRKSQLVNQKGEPFVIEVLLVDPEHEKFLLSFAKDLQTLGIRLSIRTLDTAQYWNRASQFDFDSLIFYWSGTRSPGKEQNFRWSTEAASLKGALNYPGVRDVRVDQVIRYMNGTRIKEEYTTAVHLLDRLLLEGDYVIPLFHNKKHRVAYWASLDHPDLDPRVGLGIENWWSAVG